MSWSECTFNYKKCSAPKFETTFCYLYKNAAVTFASVSYSRKGFLLEEGTIRWLNMPYTISWCWEVPNAMILELLYNAPLIFDLAVGREHFEVVLELSTSNTVHGLKLEEKCIRASCRTRKGSQTASKTVYAINAHLTAKQLVSTRSLCHSYLEIKVQIAVQELWNFEAKTWLWNIYVYEN